MTVEEFFKYDQETISYKECSTKDCKEPYYENSDELLYDKKQMMAFAEAYHQYKGAETPQLNIAAVISSKNFTFTYDELLLLLKEAYRNGYAAYEMADAGLEPYDAEGYARWVLLGMK